MMYMAILVIWPAPSRPSLKSWHPSSCMAKWPANSILTAMRPPPSAAKTVSWSRAALQLWGNFWRRIRNDRRKRTGSRAGDWPGLAEFAAVKPAATSRQSGAHRLLGLHLHQLPAHSSLRAGLAPTLQRYGPGGDWHPHAGVYLCAVRDQRRARHPGVWAHLSHRD